MPFGTRLQTLERREELLLSRCRTAGLSYLSYLFLRSPEKQLLHGSLSLSELLGQKAEG